MNKGALRKNKLLSPHRPANPDIIRRKPKEQQWSYQHRKQPTKLTESAASLLNDSPNLHSHSSHQSLINGLINDEWIENPLMMNGLKILAQLFVAWTFTFLCHRLTQTQSEKNRCQYIKQREPKTKQRFLHFYQMKKTESQNWKWQRMSQCVIKVSNPFRSYDNCKYICTAIVKFSFM